MSFDHSACMLSPQAIELGLGDAKFYDPGGEFRDG